MRRLRTTAASSNVVNLQTACRRRAAHNRSMCPRAGRGVPLLYDPLVIDEETKVTFGYRTK